MGPGAGRKVLSLHAAVRLAGHQRKALERLCRTITRPALASERLSRTITRPALASERLSRTAKGQVVLRLKSPTRDGTAHIVMQPQAFMQRLPARAPPRATAREFSLDYAT